MSVAKRNTPRGPGRVEIYLGLVVALIAFGMALAALSAAVSMCR